eukprot:1885436-Rhodomonas_salina.3
MVLPPRRITLKEKLSKLTGPRDEAALLRVDNVEVRATIMGEKLMMDAAKLREDSSRVSGLSTAPYAPVPRT